VTAALAAPRSKRQITQQTTDPAGLIDSVVRRRVLVVGAMPPLGRDLDLVARPDEWQAITQSLRSNGFFMNNKPFGRPRAWTQQWIRLQGCSSDVLDLVPVGRWLLPSDEEERFFAEAVPAEGFEWLVHPSPHHALLLLARRLAGGQVHLSPKRRRTIDRALERDPEAWSLARSRAQAWRVPVALAELERAYHTGEPPSAKARLRVAGEVLRSESNQRWTREVAKRALSSIRPRRVSVVCLSGLDGAGKSTQATVLAQTLEKLGAEVFMEWMPLGHNPSLGPIRDGVKKLLSKVGHLGFSGEVAEPSVIRSEPVIDPGKAFRQQNDKVTEAWTTVVAVTTALHHRRVAILHSWRGGIVIFDRYVLDAAAQMHYFYGDDREFRFQKWLLKTISPRPARAFFLDVPPQTVIRRKHLQYAPPQLERQYGHYKSLLEEFHVRRLPGEDPREELCELIATEVLAAVSG
jgi:thymidylate kinase